MMHIHPPKEQINSLKHLAKELAVVTIGILIALSLESCVEVLHNRHNLENARANLIAECEQNRTEIKSVLEKMPSELAALRQTANSLSFARSAVGPVNFFR